MVALFDQLHNTPNTTGPTHPNVNNLSDCVPKTHHQEILTSDIQEKVILLTRGAVRITSRGVVIINVKPYGRNLSLKGIVNRARQRVTSLMYPCGSSVREDIKLHETEDVWKPGQIKGNSASEVEAKTEAWFDSPTLSPFGYSTRLHTTHTSRPGLFSTESINYGRGYASRPAPSQVKTRDSRRAQTRAHRQQFSDINGHWAARNLKLCPEYELYKKVSSVLNKLTPQKFHTLVNQVQSLPIDNSERLLGVINLVFEKAVDEPSFSVLCAQMCKVLSNMQVPANRKTKEDSEFVEFRKPLLNRCQHEFEKIMEADLNRDEKLKEIEATIDPSLSQYFDEIRELSMKPGKISSRVRFLLQDVLELRKSKWKPCRDDSAPKTIDQIQKEAEKETSDMLIALNSAQQTPRRQDDRGGGGGGGGNTMDRRKNRGGPGGGNMNEDGWNTVAPGNRSNSRIAVDTNKFKLNKDSDLAINLGSKNLFSSWGKGAAIKMEPEKKGPQYSSTNYYSALINANEMPEERRQPPSIISSSRSGPGKSTPTPSIEKERMVASFKPAMEDSRPIQTSGHPSRSSSRDNSVRRSEESFRPSASISVDNDSIMNARPTILPPVIPPSITAEQLERKTHLLLDEFLQNANLQNFEFTLGAPTYPQSYQVASTALSMTEVENKILEFLLSSNPFDQITSWISANVGDKVADPQFIRALSTAVVRSAIHKQNTSWKLKVELLRKEENLLTKYMDNKENLELQCLFAIQALTNELEHPQGFLCQIFQTLWEDGIIPTESFLAWSLCNDGHEVTGKAVALKSLTSFFTALKETENDSSCEDS
uniref:W2 domain-containing protein n=2 Tax=Timema TaxID=61471 RepID=A0A7R9EGW7_9NEOP|nr:unnamed protein product [Timema monikensis]